MIVNDHWPETYSLSKCRDIEATLLKPQLSLHIVTDEGTEEKATAAAMKQIGPDSSEELDSSKAFCKWPVS